MQSSALFYYLIDLHYSQTRTVTLVSLGIVLLPYRFTLFSNKPLVVLLLRQFYYLIDLHYSQTDCLTLRFPDLVLLPYRFTLFSNIYHLINDCNWVLLPYRFTLFSNLKLGIKCTHYTVHGKSVRLFYNICIMIVNKIRTNHYQSQQVFRIQKLLSALSFQC